MLEALRLATALGLGVSLAAQLACVPGDFSEEGSKSRPVAEASGRADDPPRPAEQASGETSDVPIDALGSLEKVYVPILATSMLSLGEALEEKGYGNVKGSDFEPQFEHVETEFGPAVVAYSTSEWIAGESLFQPMSVTQWLEAALSDSEASGIVINPGHPGQSLALTKTEIVQAMSWLPKHDPLPMEVYVTQ